VPSIYECINQRADAIKQNRWREYAPLTPLQLTDYDTVADEDPEEPYVTLIAQTADPMPPLRSTQRSAKPYKQFRIIKRPTEVRAIMHANGVVTLDDDIVMPDMKPTEQWRWCVICKCRHPIESFVRDKRYLHHVSYACENKLRKGYHGWRWRMTA
jgi:hypothetical protein